MLLKHTTVVVKIKGFSPSALAGKLNFNLIEI